MTADAYWHEQHPLLGRTVEDIATGRTGVLRAVTLVDVPTHTGDPQKVKLAWLAPERGGQEWTTSPTNLREAR